MEASETITAMDLYGKPIKVGTTVRYITTRTLGKVIDLRKEEDRTFAQIDSSKLYYDTHYLTVTDERGAAEEDEDSVKIDLAEVERKIKDMEEALKIKDVYTDNSCEGGG
ncbi:DUF2098 domain-containing protein [Methanocella sp. MCL-LM]|uniref:DUF2098 domain-containing protein n=1 Tax=Methanocella sp. MCL-LM TaxID=3412035 RepID=UPI003C753EDE